MGEQRTKVYYWNFALVLLALVLAGFVPAGLMRPGGISSVPLLVHVHGAVFLSWFLLLCLQTRLISNNRTSLHMAMGKASVVFALAMVVLGYLVIRSAYAKPDFSIAGLSAAASVMYPFTDILNFVVVYSLGLANRRNPLAHQRLMMLAGILILDPAVSRLVITAGGPPPLILFLELALFFALLTYDWRTLRKPHWATLFGLALFALAMAAKLTIAQTPAWTHLVKVLFG